MQYGRVESFDSEKDIAMGFRVAEFAEVKISAGDGIQFEGPHEAHQWADE